MKMRQFIKGIIFGAVLIALYNLFVYNKIPFVQAKPKEGKIIYVAGQKKLSLRAETDGYDMTRNHYWAKYIIKPEAGQITSFKILVSKFYCTITPENSVCNGRPGSRNITLPSFRLTQLKKEGDSYALYLAIDPIEGKHCGSFQSDLRIVSIDGQPVEYAIEINANGENRVEKEKLVWTNCSLAVVNNRRPFNCGLPIDWQPNCTQPTPTPTNTPTPTPTNTPTPTPTTPSTPTPTPTTPPSTPTPTPQPSQNISQTVNVNQSVNIQNSANNNQQVSGVSTTNPSTPKTMPKTGAETITLILSALSVATGIYIKKKSL